jgi:predicted enzyme related to lactoylglutathione lyase
VLYFKVTDIADTQAAMVDQGAALEREPAFVAPMGDHDLWMGFLRDPEGNLVGLMEEVRPPAAR